MSKAKIIRDSEGLFYGIKIMCPACTWDDGSPIPKVLPVSWLPPGETRESPNVAGQPHWTFNGDLENPVLGPSILQDWNSNRLGRRVCHSFVGCNGAAPGQITYLSDCTHALAGSTVDLPEVE